MGQGPHPLAVGSSQAEAESRTSWSWGGDQALGDKRDSSPMPGGKWYGCSRNGYWVILMTLYISQGVWAGQGGRGMLER